MHLVFRLYIYVFRTAYTEAEMNKDLNVNFFQGVLKKYGDWSCIYQFYIYGIEPWTKHYFLFYKDSFKQDEIDY